MVGRELGKWDFGPWECGTLGFTFMSHSESHVKLRSGYGLELGSIGGRGWGKRGVVIFG